MASIFAQIRNAAEKRAAYRRTVAELSSVSTELAVEDLGFYPGDARKIAHQAIYGR
ncbi:hypothetical protein V8J82_19485 [Gymnodinialimonas sp. 2305UL16-5]|uniref:hypothetical protein n=1 Tax=Gymnodinialimonas mytili TaxID=3126503 RepID=UPI0030B6751D